MADGQAANWEDLAEECRETAARFPDDAGLADFLEKVAFNLEHGYRAINMMPEALRQKQQLGNIEAFKSVAALLRERAPRYENGELPPARGPAILRQTATVIDQLVKEAEQPLKPKMSNLQRPGFIL